MCVVQSIQLKKEEAHRQIQAANREYTLTHTHTHTHTRKYTLTQELPFISSVSQTHAHTLSLGMGWQHLAGSLKDQVSLGKKTYNRKILFPKRDQSV